MPKDDEKAEEKRIKNSRYVKKRDKSLNLSRRLLALKTRNDK